jgi:hypothetical protein
VTKKSGAEPDFLVVCVLPHLAIIAIIAIVRCGCRAAARMFAHDAAREGRGKDTTGIGCRYQIDGAVRLECATRRAIPWGNRPRCLRAAATRRRPTSDSLSGTAGAGSSVSRESNGAFQRTLFPFQVFSSRRACVTVSIEPVERLHERMAAMKGLRINQ